MSFVAIAVGGAAVIGAGASIYGGMQQAGAAKEGAKVQVAGYQAAQETTRQAGQQALGYLDPFRERGLRAGDVLERRLIAPEQLQLEKDQQNAAKRIQLEGEVTRLRKNLPQLTAASHDRYLAIETQLTKAITRLRTFDRTMATERQFDQQARDAPQPTIEASPWYQFQADLLGRTQDRAFAARGLTGSGFEAEERRRGLIELGAGETERQFGRLKGLYDVGAQTAIAGSGAITGTAQALANQQIGTAGAEAQGLYGVAGANRDMAYGIANAVTGATAFGLQYNQWDKFRADLNNRNNPTTPLTEAQQRSSLSAYNPANSSNFGPFPE